MSNSNKIENGYSSVHPEIMRITKRIIARSKKQESITYTKLSKHVVQPFIVQNLLVVTSLMDLQPANLKIKRSSKA
ncbi:hypothetical protein S70_08450 [Providencia stuartii MRSN 2154]|uniref:Uncharacterized protein n=1 Tax=Providencia stuartii (strain MRSN 2154) TaxID=1157951 RepID=A0A140NKY7_PROSM|nr:hypothetical protein S70_08450 [Providencia stuartii MRSN 2154]